MTFNKIFNIGFPKTGTTSLNSALSALGFRSIHNPKPFRRLTMQGIYHFDDDDWQALTNFGEHCYPQLDQAYPHSKFILTVRDEQAWLKSWQKQIGDSTGDEVGARWGWSRKLRAMQHEFRRIMRGEVRISHLHSRIEIFGTYRFHAERCVYVYRLHQTNARDYFQQRPDDFLIMNITAGDGWEKLCPFLEIDHLPDIPFPHKQPAPAPQGTPGTAVIPV